MARDETILEQAKQRLEQAVGYWGDVVREAQDDIAFRSGDQWPTQIARQRGTRRPMLTVNRLPAFIKQVVNDQRQNRPSIRVRAADDKSDRETANMLMGLVRNIQQISHADAAYDTAFEYAVTSGRGYFRIVTDYCDDKSFDQDILIKRVANPFSVYTDPADDSVDGSSMQWGIVTDKLTKREFESLYPSAEPMSIDTMGAGDTVDWIDEDSIRISEYFYREDEETALLLLDDGTTVYETDLEAVKQTRPFASVVRERKSMRRRVYWCKHTGAEILEKGEFPSIYIPIIPVYGDELYINGKRCLESLIRHAKDVQRMYNYWVTAETEALALTPKAPFIGAEGQFEGHEEKWKRANVDNLAYLEYKPIDLNGQLLPPPQRQPFAGPPAGVIAAKQQAVDDMKATMGIYDASLGRQSNETSGKAIIARQREGDTATFHFIDNLSRSISHAGRVLVDMIPRVYDRERVVRILGEDGAADIARLRPGMPNPEQKIYDITVGKYDVVVDSGPSYTTRRDQAVDAMLEFTRVFPPAAPMLGDKLALNMDWPEAETIAARLKALLPPEVRQAEDKPGDQPQLPPEVQQLAQQASQRIEELQAQLQQAAAQMQELQAQAQSKNGDMQVKAAELELERAELDLKRMELAMKQEESIAKLEQSRAQTDQIVIESDAKRAEAQANTALPELLSQLAQANMAVAQALTSRVTKTAVAQRLPDGSWQLVSEQNSTVQ